MSHPLVDLTPRPVGDPAAEPYGALVFAGRFETRQSISWRDLRPGCRSQQQRQQRRQRRRRTVLACDEASSSAVVFPLGRITAIMGPSGAGKTTLMRMASGRAFGTGVSIDGLWVVRRPGADAQARPVAATEATWHTVAPSNMQRMSAFVEQTDAALDPLSTPRASVRFYVDALHRARVPSPDARADMADRALGDALLGERAASTPCALLSGGQRKRASIAVQLARDCPLIFMDEPTSGLDSAASESVFAAIERTNQRRGTTVVMVVHHPSEAMLAAVHRLVLVAAGLVVYQGPPGDALAFLAASALASSTPRVVSHHANADHDVDDMDTHDTDPYRSDDDSEDNAVYYSGDDRISDTGSVAKEAEAHDSAMGREHGAVSCQRIRTTIPDRIVECVAQVPGESEPAYEQRMVELAQRAPAIAVVRPSASDARTASHESPGAFCAPSPPDCGKGGQRGRRGKGRRWITAALSTLLCWIHLTARIARERLALLPLMQTALKHTLLPALIALSLSDSVRSGNQDAVTGAHAAISLSVLWTAMDSAWEVVHVMPSLDAQYIKHREDGLYGAASHLTAVNVADSLVRAPMLTCLACIVYFGAGLDPDPGRFFVYLATVLLVGYVSRSVCFMCTCWLKGVHAITLLSLVIASNVIVGGIYAPFDILPTYARVLSYGSFVTYAMSIMVRNEFDGAGAYACAPTSCTYRTGDDAIDAFAIGDLPVWLCFVVLVSVAVLVTMATWFLLLFRARAWRRV